MISLSLPSTCGRRAGFVRWVTLFEQKWVILAERRGLMQNQRKYAAEQEWLQPQETQRFHHSGCGAPHSSPCLDRHSGDSSDHTFVHCTHRLLAQPHGSVANSVVHPQFWCKLI